MTQQTALIVHELMDQPDAWSEKTAGFITNGYYTVSLDGARYGMGVSTYQADGAQREVLLKAVQSWKDDTGWEPKPIAAPNSSAPAARVSIAPDAYIRQAHEEFARAIKSAHKSFVVHKDSTVLGTHIQQAIEKLDAILRPMEKIEGRRPNAETGGIPGA